MMFKPTRARHRLILVLMTFGGAALATSRSLAQSPLAPDARVQIAGQVSFTEGPAWHPNGNVYFTDITNNRIMRRDPKGQLHIFRTPSGRSNGLMFDQQGRMVCCEGGGPEGGRRISRLELDGTITTLAERYEGKRLNSPNDLAIDQRGRIYFSDPRYGDDRDAEQFDTDGRLVEGVYRIDLDGQLTRLIAHEVHRPNGLVISPDQRYLYVGDNVNSGPHAQGGNRKLWRFDLKEDGSVDLGSQKLLFDWGQDRGPDGMTIDQQGNLYVTAGFNFPNPPVETADKYKAGVYVINPGGELLDFVPVPMDMCTNCTFGGEDLKTLYITAGHTLWSVRTEVAGHVLK
jgi:gluconolactonase